MSTDQTQAKKKAGRPRKHPEGARRPTLAFRVRDEMREYLEAGAKARNLSISEEVERKLAFMRTLAEDPETEAVILAVVSAIKVVRTVTGKNWKDDKNTAVMTMGAIGTASAIVLAPHIGTDLTGSIEQKAQKAGEAMGHKALGFLFKLPDADLMKIGEEEMMDFRLSASGVSEADLPLVKALIKRNAATAADDEASLSNPASKE